MADNDAFAAVFIRLRSILARHAPPLLVSNDSASEYNLAVDFPNVPEPARYFGGVAIRRSYVSFYLMPVYANPELLTGASDELVKRMQGKSCFNFSKVDDGLLGELAALTDRGVRRYLERLPELLARRAR